MTDEVRREVVKLGIDFRPIPVDLGDGVEWEFHPDPSPEQWKVLVDSLKAFESMGDDAFGGAEFETAMKNFTKAMSELIVNPDQKKKWVNAGYGLGPQQAISQALMEVWTGFPTKQSSTSGKGSKGTG